MPKSGAKFRIWLERNTFRAGFYLAKIFNNHKLQTRKFFFCVIVFTEQISLYEFLPLTIIMQILTSISKQQTNKQS